MRVPLGHDAVYSFAMAANGFFDMREKLTASSRRKAAAADVKREPMTVTELTRLIDTAIRAGVPSSVTVKGETSNFSFNRASGHAYFTLKDAGACLDCVMFRDEFAAVKFQVADGMELLASGNVRVYAARGRHQLYVNRLEPVGRGALELALAQLRAKLAAEGLFDAERKKPVPRFPARIVIVTSRQTAALADMLKVLRRIPSLRLMLFHVPVQGDGSGKQIAEAIGLLNRKIADVGGADLILLGRGGGSLEDLWGFNEEVLARAIAASRIPIITGIGHETDVSIADLVADHWAHTPTEAATFAISHWRDVAEVLIGCSQQLRRYTLNLLENRQQRLIAVQRHEFFRRPKNLIDRLRMHVDRQQQAFALSMHRLVQSRFRRLDELAHRLHRNGPAVALATARTKIDRMQIALPQTVRAELRRRADRLEALRQRLESVNPQQVLRRGYTLTMLKKSGQLISSASGLKPGQSILTRFQDGEVDSTVDDPRQPRLF